MTPVLFHRFPSSNWKEYSYLGKQGWSGEPTCRLSEMGYAPQLGKFIASLPLWVKGKCCVLKGYGWDHLSRQLHTDLYSCSDSKSLHSTVVSPLWFIVWPYKRDGSCPLPSLLLLLMIWNALVLGDCQRQQFRHTVAFRTGNQKPSPPTNAITVYLEIIYKKT